MKLPAHCSVFQAKVSAIRAAVKIVVDENVHKRKITILSDSQAAIKTLDANVIRCRTVFDCRRRLNEMANCKLIIDNAIVDLNNRWAASDKGRTAWKIWPRLDRKSTATLLKLQRSKLSTVVRVTTGIARCIGLGHFVNVLCRSYGDEEKNEAVLHLLYTCPHLVRGKRDT